MVKSMSGPRSQERDTRSVQHLNLPPVPKALPKILHHLHTSEFADKEGVLAAMQCGSNLEKRVLDRVNSQLRRTVTNVEQAIDLVGATTAAGIVLKLGMNKFNVLRRGPAGSCVRQLIQHSEATAIIARHLLGKKPREGRDQNGSRKEEEDLAQSAFAKGFVHDIGKLVLIYNDPEKGAALYEDNWIEKGPAEINERDVERRAFGCDHTEAGAYAADELGFPSTLADVARNHHDTGAALTDDDSWDLRAVRAANLVTKAMESSYSGLYAQEVSLDWETCARHPVWFHWKPTSIEDPEALAEEDFILYSEFFLNQPDRRLSP